MALSLLLSVVTFASAQVVDYPFRDGLDFAATPNLGGICLVRAWGSHSSNGSPTPRHFELASVVDSPKIPVGTAVRIVGSLPDAKAGTDMYKMTRDQVYLVIGTLPEAGRFSIPAQAKGLTDTGIEADKSDLYALDVFPTSAKSIQSDGDLLADLTQCLESASTTETARVCNFLYYSTHLDRVDVARATRSLQDIAERGNATQKTLIYQLLSKWQVPGARGQFVEAVLDALSSGERFPKEYASLDLDASAIQKSELDRYDATIASFPSAERISAAVLKSKDPYLQTYALLRLPATSPFQGPETNRLIEWMLDRRHAPDEELAIALFLARPISSLWASPTLEYRDGKRKWTNREEIRRRWRQALQMDKSTAKS